MGRIHTFDINPNKLKDFYKTMENEQDTPAADTQIAVVDFNAQFGSLIPKGLDKARVETILTRFHEDVSLDPDILASALSIVVTDASQTDIIAQARAMWLTFRSERIRIEKTRKALKEQSWAEGLLIDGIARKLTGDIEPVEKHLDDQVKFIELREAARRTKLQTDRTDELLSVEYNPAGIDLANMHPDVYAALLSTAKSQKADRDQAAIDAEAERLRLEQERIEREVALAAENERLRVAQEKAQKEADRKAAEQKRVQAEFDRRQAEAVAERQRLEAEMAEKAEAARVEKERIEQEAAAEKARLEAEITRQQEEARAEKERIEREAAAKEQARVDAENARIAKEQLEERNRQAAIKAEEDRIEAERRKAAAAPDREKLLAWLSSIESVAVAPDMKDADIYNVAISVVDKIVAVAQDARDRVAQEAK